MAKHERDEEKNDLPTEELSTKIAGLEDQLLRAVAESQNIQKRADKDKADIARYSVSEFAKDVLSIRDNLLRAVSSCGQESGPVIDGIKLTLVEMDKVLARHNVVMIESKGRTFDPHLHQAIVEIEDKEAEPGTVVEVMQDGFMIHDRLLRPALVGVSKK
ncbi:MAG: nucleotide exchange factor GrpE [Holosporales bacterium]|jgi:molecular chaperone GrpE|nr:nucleotide exchange factor GrpE [Holosporales bacterium]